MLPGTSSPDAKQRMLEAAQDLMLARGFVATSVEDICEAARVTKGGFFHHFESKEELGKQLLLRFYAKLHEAMLAGPFMKEADPLRRVTGYVDFTIAVTKDPLLRNGCLIGTFAQELSESHPGLRAVCAEGFAGWAGSFRRELEEAKRSHAPRTAFDPGSVAEHLIAVLEGAFILAKARKDFRVVQEHLLHFKRYLQSLFESSQVEASRTRSPSAKRTSQEARRT